MKPSEQSVARNCIGRTSARLAGATWPIILAAVFLAAHAAQAATYTWTAASPDYYTNSAAWDLASVPGSADTADIANNGTALYDSTMTNVLQKLWFGSLDGSGGTFTMSGGMLSITNVEAVDAFIPGYYNNSTGLFTLNGGTLTVARPSTQNRYFQDSFQPGYGIGASGTVTVNNGTLNILCGCEVGISGDGYLNVNGGTVIANGWFTMGRGLTANQGYGSGTFNLTGGTVYVLKNGGTGAQVGMRLLQLATAGTANISGGTLYCSTIQLGNAGNSAGTATLNVSGGTIYLGDGGVVANTYAPQVKVINVSGGTFRTVNLGPNANGTNGLTSVLSGGTNWTWSASGMPTINLASSPGLGMVTFAPEANRTITLNSSWAGPGGMTIAGPGTVVFGATNTYTGGTTVSGGTLQLNLGQPASLISGLVVNSGATLALSSAQLNAPIGSATFNSGSALNLNNNAQIIDSTFTIPSGVVLRFNASNTQYFTNNVAGAGNVSATLGGNGFEIVTGNLGHSGSTTVSTGTLVIGGTLNNSSGVIVTNTGTLAGNGLIGAPIVIASTNSPTAAHLRIGISPMNVPDTLTVSNLTLGAGSELDVKLGATTTVGGGVNDLLVVQGNLTIDPNAFLNVLPMQGLAAGTYVVATYTGILTGQFTNTVGGLTRYGFTLDYGTVGQIKLNVSGSNANLVWMGVTNNVAATNWDVLTTANWSNSATLLADTFREGDAVTLDDTTRNTNVVLAAALYPASITFNGNTNWSVTGTGSGRITGGTGLTKNGNGTVLLAAGLGLGNDYTGPVQINGGILKMNGALSLGATNGATTVAVGATLDLNGQTPNAEPMTIQGAGFGGTSGAINNSGAQLNLSGGPRRITLAGDTTINAASNRWDIGINTLGAGGGYFIGNGYKLTKIGTKDIYFHEVGDIGVGDIFVNQGTLGFQYTIGMGNPANTVFVAPAATLSLWQVPGVLNKNAALTNATIYSNGSDAGTSNVLSGTITLTGTNTINVANYSLSLLGPIVGTGGFQKAGTGPLYLFAANTYSGSTFVNAGSIVLGPGGSIANFSLIALATNTVLDASLAGGLSLGSGQTLSGWGSVTGNGSAGTGSQLAPGSAVAAGTLVFNNNLTLNGATNIIKLSGDPNTIGGGVNDLISVANALTASGVSTLQINPIGTLSAAAPYSVMQYAGTPPSAANFRVVSSSARYTASLVDPATTAPYIQVNITGNPGLLVWKGGAASNPNIWDNITTNWLNVGTGLRDAYFSGDNAIFDDTATTNTVNLATIALGLISMSNNATPYTFTGNGFLTAALDMEGTGSLRLAVSNPPAFSTITANSGTLIFDLPGPGTYTNYATISDNGGALGTIVKAGTNTMVLSAPDNSSYSGTIIISNGILQYTNALALGSALTSLYATNTGSLDLNGLAISGKPIVIAGNGFNGQGALTNSGPGIVNAGVGSLTLVGDASIGGINRFDFSALNGNGFKLTELGPGANLILAGETSLGDIHIVAGRLGFQSTTVTMGDPNKTATVESNAVLTLYNATVTKNLVLNGSATIDAGGGNNTFNGSVTLVGTNNLFGLRIDLHLTGAIGGAGSMVVGDSPVGAGGGTLWLDGANPNTYSGQTTIINGHKIVVGASSSLGASSLIQVNSGGTLDVSAPASFNLGAGQTLIGAGTVVGGAIVFGSGATLAAGFPDNNTYTLTMNGSLTLQSGSTNIVVVNKTGAVANDTVAGLTSVTMGGTLVITNVGNPLADGDAIQLFSASSGYSGSFGNIIPTTPGASLVWDLSTLNSDGKLRVLRTGPPTTPTNIVFSLAGNQLTLSWPTNYIGWTLQEQTNAPGVGITTNWYDVPNSATTNQFIIPIDAAHGSVFFRMILR